MLPPGAEGVLFGGKVICRGGYFFGWSGFVPFGEVYKYREQGCSFFCEVIIYPYRDFRDNFFGDECVFFEFFQLFAQGLIGDGG